MRILEGRDNFILTCRMGYEMRTLGDRVKVKLTWRLRMRSFVTKYFIFYLFPICNLQL